MSDPSFSFLQRDLLEQGADFFLVCPLSSSDKKLNDNERDADPTEQPALQALQTFRDAFLCGLKMKLLLVWDSLDDFKNAGR